MKTGERSYITASSTYYWNADDAALVVDNATFTVSLLIAAQAPILLDTFGSLDAANQFAQTIR